MEKIKKPDKIITDDLILKDKSRDTTWKEVENHKLWGRLKLAIKTGWTPGMGLAAVQIGIPIRAAWLKNAEDEDIFLVNPIIKSKQHLVVLSKEGCLSIPDKWFSTIRWHEISYETTVKDGIRVRRKAKGYEAVCIQHEIDHMNGILCMQRKYEPKDLPGRNDPCYCGSGKKFKKCCIDKTSTFNSEEEKDES